MYAFIALRSCYVASFEFKTTVGLLMIIPFLAEMMLCRVVHSYWGFEEVSDLHLHGL